MNENNKKRAVPPWPTWLAWLDARTIAMLTTMITAALALGTMVQTAHAGLGGEIGQLRQDMHNMRQDMHSMRQELRTDIENVRTDLGGDINRLDGRVDKLDDRLRSVEVGVAAIGTAMGFDARLRVVEGPAPDADKMPGPDRHDG